MTTKLYVVNGFKRERVDEITVFDRLVYTQVFGSVTEVCKFVKKMYNMEERLTRELIVEAFGINVKTTINIPDTKKYFNVSQHKVETEVRVHGNYK